MKQALEKSETNFVPQKLNHTLHLAWGLYYLSMPNGLPEAQSQGTLLNTRNLFMKQALERSEQNFVTKLNHAQHFAWGLYYMSMHNGLYQAQSYIGDTICQNLK